MKYKNEANTTMNICYTDIYDMEELDNRRLYINNDIDNEIIDTIVYHILRFNRIDKDKKPEERKPILLYINSPGGDVYSMDLSLPCKIVLHQFIRLIKVCVHQWHFLFS